MKKLLNILFEYKDYSSEIDILEPSFGTGNFIEILKERGFTKIDGCAPVRCSFSKGGGNGMKLPKNFDEYI